MNTRERSPQYEPSQQNNGFKSPHFQQQAQQGNNHHGLSQQEINMLRMKEQQMKQQQRNMQNTPHNQYSGASQQTPPFQATQPPEQGVGGSYDNSYQQQGEYTQNDYKDFQIIRIDGRNVFVEFMRNAFEIGKVRMNFIEYDQSKQAGSRQSNYISIYMDIPEFLQLAFDYRSGKLHRLAEQARQHAQNSGSKYAKEIYTQLGGTSAQALSMRGQARADNMSISRQFKVTPGAKQPWILSAEQGAGKQNEKGLIVPQGRAEQVVRVPFTDDSLVQVFETVRMEIQAFYTAQRLKEMLQPSPMMH